MQHKGPHLSRHGLDSNGVTEAKTAFWNLSPAELYEHAVRRGEGVIAEHGPLVCRTGDHTGRSPKDKFTVREPSSEADIWWGHHNRALSPEHFEGLLDKAKRHAKGREVYVFNGYAGADPRFRLRVRVINEYAWHNLFVRNMFVRETDPAKLADFKPDFTVVDFPSLRADPAADGTASSTFIALNFARRMVLIGGTEYGGEMKKSIFSVMNYVLPKQGILSMHCGANYGRTKDDVALFFGLSGTGKTTLSADPERTLVGDDEHAWGEAGIFNIEGGCYAKVIRLSPEGEPDIYATTRRFGTVLENVVCDPETRRLNLDDPSLTENTRACYELGQIRNADLTGVAGHAKTVVFLTADAFGVLPPIARLTPAQALYHFLSGYTAKVAGTERGVTEPGATFSTCFGAPFLPLHPTVYATMLGERLAHHGAKVWLVNTGWTGGPYGEGQRIKLGLTRRMVSAVLAGQLDATPTVSDPVFGLAVPTRVDGVPEGLLLPRATWKDPASYDTKARKVAAMFAENFKQFEGAAAPEVRAAGPRIG